MTTAIEKETAMSNDNEIYPLDEHEGTGSLIGSGPKRSLNQRLAPIYRALADDPDGWEKEGYVDDDGGRWQLTVNFPMTHKDCEHFRLVRKPQTITVEMDEPNDDPFIEMQPDNSAFLCIPFDNYGQAKAALNKIRSAMEGR